LEIILVVLVAIGRARHAWIHPPLFKEQGIGTSRSISQCTLFWVDFSHMLAFFSQYMLYGCILHKFHGWIHRDTTTCRALPWTRTFVSLHRNFRWAVDNTCPWLRLSVHLPHSICVMSEPFLAMFVS
jgi:hypothetical protein